MRADEPDPDRRVAARVRWKTSRQRSPSKRVGRDRRQSPRCQMGWFQRLFRTKPKRTVQELAEKLAIKFSAEVKRLMLDKSSNKWLWDSLPQGYTNVVVTELAVATLFLRSIAFFSVHEEQKHHRGIAELLRELRVLRHGG